MPIVHAALVDIAGRTTLYPPVRADGLAGNWIIRSRHAVALTAIERERDSLVWHGGVDLNIRKAINVAAAGIAPEIGMQLSGGSDDADQCARRRGHRRPTDIGVPVVVRIAKSERI